MAVYATIANLGLSLPADAIVGIDPAVIEQFLAVHSRYVDNYLPAQFGGIDPANIPLEVTKAVTDLAAPDILTARGVAPDAPELTALWRRAELTRAWLRDVRSGKAALSLPDITPTIEEGAPEVGYPDARTYDACEDYDDGFNPFGGLVSSTTPRTGRGW